MPVLDSLGAIAVAFLPRRHWPGFDWLPLHRMVPVAGILTMLAGAALGIRGFFAYLERLAGSPAASILEVSRQQAAGALPETGDVSAVPAAIWAVAPIAFAFFTPLGVFSMYLVTSGWLRVAGWWVGAAHGDPILTGIDTLVDRVGRRSAATAKRRIRERAEGVDEPDRRYPGSWADLPDVDFVVVAARRKPDWTTGTFVITPEGWFTLGEPFDRPMRNGLRTVYPLTALTTLDVIRRGVACELPPLSNSRSPE